MHYTETACCFICRANSKTLSTEVALSKHLKSGLWINLIALSSFTSECLWSWMWCSANILWYLFTAYHSGKCCCNIFPENEKRSKTQEIQVYYPSQHPFPEPPPSAEIFRWLSENIFGNIPSLLIRWQKCLFYLIMVVKLILYFFIFLFSIRTFLICLLSSWPHKIWLVMKRPNGPHWNLSEDARGVAD